MLGDSVPTATLNLYSQVTAAQSESTVAAAGTVMRQILGGLETKPGSQLAASRTDCNQGDRRGTRAEERFTKSS
jgi:hypothetical protein